MLGRKQSLKGEPILADYGPEESLNESADIEWVNKVRKENVAVELRCSLYVLVQPLQQINFLYFDFSVMGP